MDLTLRTESFANDDQSWLGSAHGTDMGRSIALDTSTFPAGTHYPNGFLLSGLPLGLIANTTNGGTVGKYGPYDPVATDGRDTVVGFLLTATRVNPADTAMDPSGALFIHGVIVAAKLPVSVDTNGKADVAGRIIFV